MQKQRNEEVEPIAYKSRALTPTEQRYVQIEKEAFASTWACVSLSYYLLGLHFHIETDHKPLVPLFNPRKCLDELPLRVQWFHLCMMRYSFSISHVPGKSLAVADTLSWAPTAKSTSSDEVLQNATAFHVASILSYIPATQKRVAEIKRHQHEDKTCKQLIDYCLSQWPHRRDLSEEIRACIRTCVHTCMRTYVRAYVQAYVRACIRACVRTCVHTCTRTYVQLRI